jgi:hypothetical protein
MGALPPFAEDDWTSCGSYFKERGRGQQRKETTPEWETEYAKRTSHSPSSYVI